MVYFLFILYFLLLCGAVTTRVLFLTNLINMRIAHQKILFQKICLKKSTAQLYLFFHPHYIFMAIQIMYFFYLRIKSQHSQALCSEWQVPPKPVIIHADHAILYFPVLNIHNFVISPHKTIIIRINVLRRSCQAHQPMFQTFIFNSLLLITHPTHYANCTFYFHPCFSAERSRLRTDFI